jgi:hypothetical protein
MCTDVATRIAMSYNVWHRRVTPPSMPPVNCCLVNVCSNSRRIRSGALGVTTWPSRSAWSCACKHYMTLTISGTDTIDWLISTAKRTCVSNNAGSRANSNHVVVCCRMIAGSGSSSGNATSIPTQLTTHNDIAQLPKPTDQPTDQSIDRAIDSTTCSDTTTCRLMDSGWKSAVAATGGRRRNER